VHDDLVQRDFTADRPDKLWLTGITEHPTGEGKFYLCAVKDACSGRIVGYSTDSKMKSSLAVAALRNAIALRSPAGTVVVHSDRGSQFRSHAYVRTLRAAGLTGSMGRAGACGYNAATESFFALLQKNVLDRRRWDTRDDLRLAVITWIERTYHRRRRQRRLGKLTPHRIRDAVHHGCQSGLTQSAPESTKSGAVPSIASRYGLKAAPEPVDLLGSPTGARQTPIGALNRQSGAGSRRSPGHRL
jgi:putative transposase